MDPSDAKGLLEVIDIDGNGKEWNPRGWIPWRKKGETFFQHFKQTQWGGVMLQSSKKGKKNGLLWKNLGEEEKLCKNGGFVKGFLFGRNYPVTWEKSRRESSVSFCVENGKSHPMVGAFKSGGLLVECRQK